MYDSLRIWIFDEFGLFNLICGLLSSWAMSLSIEHVTEIAQLYLIFPIWYPKNDDRKMMLEECQGISIFPKVLFHFVEHSGIWSICR